MKRKEFSHHVTVGVINDNGNGSVPGYLRNGTVILTDPDAQSGIIRMRNLGPLGLAVGGLDGMGNEREPHLYLKSGETAQRFSPPARTVKIMVMGQVGQTGSATLEYDVPWWS